MQRQLVLKCTPFDLACAYLPFPFKDLDDILYAALRHFPAKRDRLFEDIIRDDRLSGLARNLWLEPCEALCLVAVVITSDRTLRQSGPYADLLLELLSLCVVNARIEQGRDHLETV